MLTEFFFQNAKYFFPHKCSILSNKPSLSAIQIFIRLIMNTDHCTFLFLGHFLTLATTKGLSIQITAGQLKFNFNLGDYRYTKVTHFY